MRDYNLNEEQRYDLETNSQRLGLLVENLFRRVHIGSHKDRVRFLKEDALDIQQGRFAFCLQEATKAVTNFDKVINFLTMTSKKQEKELKNKIEKSNNTVIKDILRSQGDIAKVDVIQKVIRLLNISLDINGRYLARLKTSHTPAGNSRLLTDKVANYNKAANDFITLYNVLIKYRNDFKKVIAQELDKPYEKQFFHQLYTNIVLFIQIYGNALYSLGIMMDNPRAAITTSSGSDIYFVYQSEMDEPMAIVNGIRASVVSGDMFRQTNIRISEEFMDLVEQHRSQALNEGFLDVISGLVTTTTIGQFLMIPVYLIRSVTYLILFLGASYSTISDSISSNIEFISKNDRSQEEFDIYKKDVENVARNSINALNSSEMAVKHELSRSTNTIRTMKDEPTPMVSNSTSTPLI